MGKICPKCKDDKDIGEYYNRRGKIGGSVYCKECTNKQALDRQRDLKQKSIDYKGGLCEVCGYDKCNSALEFHHKDPNEKDFSISNVKKYTFDERIKNELDKCVLLCSNCHREVHAGLIKL